MGPSQRLVRPLFGHSVQGVARVEVVAKSLDLLLDAVQVLVSVKTRRSCQPHYYWHIAILLELFLLLNSFEIELVHDVLVGMLLVAVMAFVEDY